MKLKLTKKKIKSLSQDSKVLPGEVTPNIAGGSTNCNTATNPGTGLIPEPTAIAICGSMGRNTCNSCGCASDPRDHQCGTFTCR